MHIGFLVAVIVFCSFGTIISLINEKKVVSLIFASIFALAAFWVCFTMFFAYEIEQVTVCDLISHKSDIGVYQTLVFNVNLNLTKKSGILFNEKFKARKIVYKKSYFGIVFEIHDKVEIFNDETGTVFMFNSY